MNSRRQAPLVRMPQLHDVRSDLEAQLLASSDQHLWTGNLTRFYSVAPHPDFAVVPEYITNAVHAIVIHRAGPLRLSARNGNRIEHAQSQPGQICLMAQNDYPATSWTDHAEIVHIYLAPSLITALADDHCRADPTQIRLKQMFSITDPLIEALGANLLNELHSPWYAGRMYAESLTQTLALHLLRTYTTTQRFLTVQDHRLSPLQLRRVIEYIEAHLNTDLALHVLAAQIGYSPAYFARQFKLTMGLSPHQYVIQRRVQKAKDLIETGRWTLAQVARMTGFVDQSHLTRLFKRELRISPSHISKSARISQD